jgi:glycosyltransferase involved in cell wall biosynthesis
MKTALLVYWGILSGIGKDVRIVSRILEANGYGVKRLPTRRREDRRERVGHFLRQAHRLFFPYPLQVHLEQIHREQFRLGHHNFVFINPEWTDVTVFGKMKQMPWILCKTRHGEALCHGLGSTVRYVGFTSEDLLDSVVEKDYKLFLHVAGRSAYKGTRALYNVWARNPQWPKLHILRARINHYGEEEERLGSLPNVEVHEDWMADEDFRTLSNQCGVHLCPSEMEGFGHTLMEGMSTGAILVATNGSPMNELVRPERGFLVEAKETGRNFMSPRYAVSEEALEQTITKILEKPERECRELGRAARCFYEANDAAFRCRMQELVEEINSRG